MAGRHPRPARACVAGATGLVGRALLARLLKDRRVGSVSALRRRGAAALPAGVSGLEVDYATLGSAQAPALPPVDWAFCCLGTTIKVAGSQAAFRAVDFDAVLAFARAAQAAGASRLAVVSALGADAGSRVFYNRVKGEMEQALAGLGLRHLVIVRPSLLLGERRTLGQPGRPGERLAQALMPALGWMIPAKLRPIRADAVAAALIEALAHAPKGVQIVESDALQRLAGQVDQAGSSARR
jgi:uncharacterized protein YbjT (DUF2867 family)